MGTELAGDPVADQGFDSTASEHILAGCYILLAGDGLVDMTEALRKPLD